MRSPSVALSVVGLLVVTLFPLAPPGAATQCPTFLDDWCDSTTPPGQPLQDTATNPYEYFGTAIDVDGDRFIVGIPGNRAPNGDCEPAAVIYQTGAGGAAPVPLARLEPPANEGCTSFGESVALHGDIAVVGVPWYELVHVYERNAFGEWPLQVTIPRDENCFAFGFGHSLALDDGILFVGGMFGFSVCTFARDPVTGRWAADEQVWDNTGAWDFGFALDVSAGRLAASAPSSYNPQTGSYGGFVQIMVRDGPGTGWYVDATIDSEDMSDDARFGMSLAFTGDRLVVGAPEDFDPLYEAGAAYVFDYDQGSDSWQQVGRLLAPPEGDAAWFGRSIALSEDRVLVGAPGGSDFTGDGRAFLFARDAATGTWVARDELAPPGGGDPNDSFGWKVGFLGAGGLIAAPNESFAAIPGQEADGTGAVYVYAALL